MAAERAFSLLPPTPETAPSPQLLSQHRLQECWNALAGDDAARAYRVIDDLSRSPEQAVKLFKDRVRPTPASYDVRFRRLLDDLDSDQFSVREKAAAELANLPDLDVRAVQDRLVDTPSLEVNQQLERLLPRLGKPLHAGEPLRLWRVIETLERIGTPEAEEVLCQLARGARTSRLTGEASNALEFVRQHSRRAQAR